MAWITSIKLKRQSAILLLLLLGLCLRALVPSGYMLIAQGKTIKAYICGDSVMAQSIIIPMQPDAAPHDPADSRGDMAPCAFAAMAWTAQDAPIVTATIPFFDPQSPPQLVQDMAAIGHGLAAPPPPKTGPPIRL
jgi:hypothetical protein